MSDGPYSHSILEKEIPPTGRRFELEPTAEQRAAIAEALDIIEIRSLAATLEVRPAMQSALRVRGSVQAVVVQNSVLTLDPVEQSISEEIDLTLVRAETASRTGHPQQPLYVDALEDDIPDVYANGRIDLGVIVTEHLAVALDPYPRAPGSEFPGHFEGDGAPDASPFATLQKLKRGEG